MEPFSLTIEQINFEAEDPSYLRSFDGDIVFYDTDLRSSYIPPRLRTPVASYNTVFLKQKKGSKESVRHLKKNLSNLEKDLEQLVTQIHSTSKLYTRQSISDSEIEQSSPCHIESNFKEGFNSDLHKTCNKISGARRSFADCNINGGDELYTQEDTAFKNFDLSSYDKFDLDEISKNISPKAPTSDHLNISLDSEFAFNSLNSPKQDYNFGHLALHSESSLDITNDSIPVKDTTIDDTLDLTLEEVRTVFDQSFATKKQVETAKDILHSVFLENFNNFKKTVFESKKGYFNSPDVHAINFLRFDLDSSFTMDSNEKDIDHIDHSSSAASHLTTFSTTTDALALQESVIGNSNIKPASPEIVAQVVAEAQRKLLLSQQGNSSQDSFRTVSPSLHEPPEKLMPSAAASPIDETHTFDIQSSQQSSNHRTRDLIRVPTESITTIKSKGSGVIESTNASPSKSPRKSKKKDPNKMLFSSLPSEQYQISTPSHGSSEEELTSIRPLEIDVVLNDITMSTRNYSPPVKDVGLEIPSDIVEARSKPQELGFLISSRSEGDFIGSHLKSSQFQENTYTSSTPKIEDSKSSDNMKNVGYYDLMRQKANLEGQLESIRSEANIALQERARLQAELAATQSQLKSQIFQSQQAIFDKSKLNSQLEILMESQQKLVRNLEELQYSYDAQLLELKTLNEELLETQDSKDKLLYQIDEIKLDLRSKDGIVQDLKKKIAELSVELQLAVQSKSSNENELRVAQNDIAALVKAKQWYQEQLNTVQEARRILQQEFMALQSNAVIQSSSIEKLKAANSQLRQELMETQQKAMQEKEMLMRYLENIEADMVEREVAYDQIQREKTSTEETFSIRVQRIEEERTRLASMISNTSDMDRQLTITQNELRLKESTLELVDHELAEIMKQLTMSQESLVENSRALEILQQEYMEVDSKLKVSKQQLIAKDKDILKLKDEKAAVQVALASAVEEKKAFDDALQKLRNNMGSVEHNFKQIRQEVSTKTNLLQKAESEKKILQALLAETKGSSTDLPIEKFMFDKLKAENSQLQIDLSRINEEHNNLKVSFEKTNEEKLLLKSELDSTKAHFTEIKSQLSLTLEKQQNLQKELQRIETSSETSVIEESSKIQENAELTSNERNAKDRQESFKSTVEIINKKLQEILLTRENTDKRFQELIFKCDLSETNRNLFLFNWDRFIQEFNTVNDLKETLTLELANMRLKANEKTEYYDTDGIVEGKDAEKPKSIDIVDQNAEDDQQLMMELEKEKGRLAGMTQSFEALKQHANMLEAMLARKESEIIELEERNKILTQTQEQLKSNATKQFQSLSDELMDDKKEVKNLRKQIATQKGQNVRLKRERETLKMTNNQFNQELEKKNAELLSLQNSLDQQQQGVFNDRTEQERLLAERASLQKDVDRLKREVTDSLARDPLLKEEIKTLTWQLSQKHQELNSLKDQLHLSEARQQLDKDNINKAYQMSCDEIAQLKMEIMTTRKEKYSYQSKLIELRAALKTGLQQNQKLKTALAEHESQVVLSKIIESTYDEEAINELLKQSAPSLNSKPLSNLQSCLVKLQNEMSSLKQKMEEHHKIILTCGSA